MTAKATTSATFEQDVLKADGPVLVDFWAEWCGPCRMVSPVLDQIQQENSDKITVVKLNVDENPDLAMQYQITSIPAMKVFKDGEVATTIIGAKPKAGPEAGSRCVPEVRTSAAATRPPALISSAGGRVVGGAGQFCPLRFPDRVAYDRCGGPPGRRLGGES